MLNQSLDAGSDSNEKASIQTTVEQYGLQGLVLDLVVQLTLLKYIRYHINIRCAIMPIIRGDPWKYLMQLFVIVSLYMYSCFKHLLLQLAPYGVRAGAKKIGVLPGQTPNVPDEVRGKKHPKVVDYELDELVFDLLRFASLLLRPGGRLVYWLPVINDE